MHKTVISFCLLAAGSWAAEPARVIVPEPSSSNFGKHPMGKIVERTYSLRNVGGQKATNLNVEIDADYVFRFKGGEYPGEGGTCGKSLDSTVGRNECTIVLEGSVVWPYSKEGVFKVSYQGGQFSKALRITGLANESAPVAVSALIRTEEDHPIGGILKANDADGDKLSFSITQQPANGTVSLSATNAGEYEYRPRSGFSGTDTFAFKASDGQKESKPMLVTVMVKPAAKEKTTATKAATPQAVQRESASEGGEKAPESSPAPAP